MRANGQVHISTGHPQFAYASLDDFIGRQADTLWQLRKMDDVRVDSLVARSWFTDKQLGMVKDVFALQYDGLIYFQEQAIRQSLPASFHPHARKDSHCFYPVLEKGRYYYLVILSEDKDPDLSTAMGLMAGAVGNVMGTAMTPEHMSKSCVVYDTLTTAFYGFDTWKEIEHFMNTYYPNQLLKTKSGPLDYDAVRALFARLNHN